MQIDSSFKTAAASLAPKQTKSPSAQNPSVQDEVSLSQLADTLKSSEAPPVNLAKIQEIKQAISEGRFQINPEAIADNLIESARDLVARNKRQA